MHPCCSSSCSLLCSLAHVELVLLFSETVKPYCSAVPSSCSSAAFAQALMPES